MPKSQRVPFFATLPNFANRLLNEIPLYIQLATNNGYDGTDRIALANWWSLVRGQLPEWSIVVSCAVLFVPSSAGAERVFSMVSFMFDDGQDAALEDFKEGSLMLRYNTIWRSKYV